MAAVDDLTERIIGCAYTVSNELGSGFLERVYENALVIELRKNGLEVRQQAKINVYYDQAIVGEYFADLIVENQILIELKAARAIDDNHIAQCLNYLRATRLRICLILNFGTPKVQIKRLAL